MGKGDKRGKRGFDITKLDLKPAPRAKKRGRARMDQAGRKGPSAEWVDAMNARAVRLGCPPTHEGRKAVSGSHMGCQAGLVLEHMFGRKVVDRAWTVYCNWLRAQWLYSIHVLDVRPGPASPAMEMLHEQFQARYDSAPDDRTADEKHRDAVNMMAAWDAHLGQLAVKQRLALTWARDDVEGTLWNGAPTECGRMAARALDALADVVEENT